MIFMLTVNMLITVGIIYFMYWLRKTGEPWVLLLALTALVAGPFSIMWFIPLSHL